MPHRLSLLLALAAACGGPHPRPAHPAADRARLTRQDTLPAFTTAPVGRAVSSRAPVVLRAARTETDSSVDRLVLEFAGDTLPGYEAAYATGPVVRCGSGDTVPLAGSDRLVLRVAPAQAHDDRGQVTIPEREWAPQPAFGALRDVKLICDFEGQVEWALGVAGRRPYRVLETTSPARLTLEVRRP